MLAIKEMIKGIPFIGALVRRGYKALTTLKDEPKPPLQSHIYWEERYTSGGNSGVGSYGKFARFKADVINSFVEDNGIGSVIEFGCGDGHQLKLANYHRYTGLDISRNAIARCRDMFAHDESKTFLLMDAYTDQKADLALSLDVIYHLIEDDVFEVYMHKLFDSATRFAIIYSSDIDENKGYENSHVRHRKFTSWVKANIKGWSLKQNIPN
ncbi:MAG: class I SAM-dependent methyltransferase [Alphaproteobacteria bacterium]|nr:class I SAM-dependent methyltransferase [Alphaproteobacteria bacterium]